MLITESLRSHVTQSDSSFAAAVDELIAVDRVELCSSNHLSKLLHVGWFDVNNI